jgi:predicted nucleotidyltransferase
LTQTKDETLPITRLSQIAAKKEDRKARLESSLVAIVQQLKNMGALRIILFGSLAHGDVDLHSDLDLLAVMPATRSTKEWMGVIYDTVERGVACDIIAYNEQELKEELTISRFLQHVVTSGKVVYEKTV